MPYRIESDTDVCQGFANCVMNAPDLFDLDDEDTVVVLKREVGDDEFAYADQAVRSCPVEALSLLEQ